MAESKLTDLIAKLEAATEGSRELDAEIAVALSGDPEAWVVNPAPHSIFSPIPGWWRTGDDESHEAPDFTTSLDAIVALIERKLPVWCIVVESTPKSDHPSGNKACARIMLMSGGGTDRIAARTPPLTLCIALLSALQLQGGSEQ